MALDNVTSHFSTMLEPIASGSFLSSLSGIHEIRKPNSKPVVIVTWNRPPNSPNEVFSSLENLIGRLDSENVEFYLMGDINCNMASMSDSNSRLLCNITDLYGLHQLINEPTRVTDTTSTLIDLIYTNYPDKAVCSGVFHVSISDHSLNLFLLIESCRLEPFPKGTILLATEVLKISIVTIFAATLLLKTGMS